MGRIRQSSSMQENVAVMIGRHWRLNAVPREGAVNALGRSAPDPQTNWPNGDS